MGAAGCAAGAGLSGLSETLCSLQSARWTPVTTVAPQAEATPENLHLAHAPAVHVHPAASSARLCQGC